MMSQGPLPLTTQFIHKKCFLRLPEFMDPVTPMCCDACGATGNTIAAINHTDDCATGHILAELDAIQVVEACDE